MREPIKHPISPSSAAIAKEKYKLYEKPNPQQGNEMVMISLTDLTYMQSVLAEREKQIKQLENQMVKK